MLLLVRFQLSKLFNKEGDDMPAFDFKEFTAIAINTTTFDKYKPGKQLFFVQALTPTGDKTNKFKPIHIRNQNIKNKNTGALNINHPQVGYVIEIEVPKDVTRWFEVKFIPKGTRFVMNFDSGDITKPRIIARDYFEEQGSYNREPKDGGDTWPGFRI